jgi:hypothetical protein
VADSVELHQDILLYCLRDVARLEADGVDEELLLNWCDGVVEQTRLGPVVEKSPASAPLQGARELAPRCGEETFALGLVGLLGKSLV